MIHSHVTWLIHTWLDSSFTCDMTHLYVTWLIHMWHDSFTSGMTHSYVTRLNHVWHDPLICDMTHWPIHMWHDSFIRNITHSYVWYDSFICVTWLLHMWHDSFICDITHSYVTSLIHMWRLIHTWHDSKIAKCYFDIREIWHVANQKRAVLFLVLCFFTGFARPVWGRFKCSRNFFISSDLCTVFLFIREVRRVTNKKRAASGFRLSASTWAACALVSLIDARKVYMYTYIHTYIYIYIYTCMYYIYA